MMVKWCLLEMCPLIIRETYFIAVQGAIPIQPHSLKFTGHFRHVLSQEGLKLRRYSDTSNPRLPSKTVSNLPRRYLLGCAGNSATYLDSSGKAVAQHQFRLRERVYMRAYQFSSVVRDSNDANLIA